MVHREDISLDSLLICAELRSGGMAVYKRNYFGDVTISVQLIAILET